MSNQPTTQMSFKIIFESPAQIAIDPKQREVLGQDIGCRFSGFSPSPNIVHSFLFLLGMSVLRK